MQDIKKFGFNSIVQNAFHQSSLIRYILSKNPITFKNCDIKQNRNCFSVYKTTYVIKVSMFT